MGKIKNIWIISSILITTLVVAALALPQFAGIRTTISILAKDGHFLTNAGAYLTTRREFAYRRHEERKLFNTKANAAKHLETPTYDSTGQGMHPDVLYFENGFHGYKFWMAFTPYPYAEMKKENPSILVSNDGLHWAVPPGLRNPLVPIPADSKEGGHYSDTDIMYIGGKLVVHFVYNKEGLVGPSKVFRIESSDGIAWSPLKLVYTTNASSAAYSPAFIYSNSMYKMWFFAGEDQLLFASSKDGLKWDAPRPIDLKIPDWRTWHIDVIETDLGYEAIIACRKDHTNTRALYYASSKDGINWEVKPQPVIYPSENSWDSGGIYRSTFVKRNGVYKVWYSAYDRADRWHIGYTEGENIENLRGRN